MELESIDYIQNWDEPEKWSLEDFTPGKINLIVGKNATGKTRTLNIIGALGNLISGDGKLKFKSGNYKATFNKGNKNIIYYLTYEDSKVIKEKLIVNKKTMLDRKMGGKGKIYAQKQKELIDFQAPENQIVSVTRRDSVQHPFFEDLYNWGNKLRIYRFGTPLGKDHLAAFMESKEETELDLKNASQVVAIFRKGKKEYPRKFVEQIKRDMKFIGFELTNIELEPPKGLVVLSGPIAQPVGIMIKESDLLGKTDQHSMSQGMFRALSLFININYSQMSSIPSCILIDDIGEGLDYDRSSSLVKLLIEKSKNSKVQLIMSTNDRFVMNNVPLEYWSVCQRFANKTKILNYNNARKIFDDFELTGLNNFDFFSSQFYEKGGDKK